MLIWVRGLFACLWFGERGSCGLRSAENAWAAKELEASDLSPWWGLVAWLNDSTKPLQLAASNYNVVILAASTACEEYKGSFGFQRFAVANQPSGSTPLFVNICEHRFSTRKPFFLDLVLCVMLILMRNLDKRTIMGLTIASICVIHNAFDHFEYLLLDKERSFTCFYYCSHQGSFPRPRCQGLPRGCWEMHWKNGKRMEMAEAI